MRTTDETYASGWAYQLHYGVLEPTVAPDPKPEIIEFPGMVELWNRFWTEVPNDEFEVP